MLINYVTEFDSLPWGIHLLYEKDSSFFYFFYRVSLRQVLLPNMVLPFSGYAFGFLRVSYFLPTIARFQTELPLATLSGRVRLA